MAGIDCAKKEFELSENDALVSTLHQHHVKASNM